MLKTVSTLLALQALLAAGAADMRAQHRPRTNVEILGDLAVGCVGDVPDTLSAFILESAGGMTYLRPRLTSHWREEGRQIFVADSAGGLLPPKGLFRLGYQPEEARVIYTADDGSVLNRLVALSIGFSLLAPSGRLVDEGRCRDQYSDSISRDEVLLVERDPFPEAKGEVPPAGSWRDWAEPVALGAAIGVVAYLFFTVRSS